MHELIPVATHMTFVNLGLKHVVELEALSQYP